MLLSCPILHNDLLLPKSLTRLNHRNMAAGSSMGAAATTGGRFDKCLLLSLPPELREMIYKYLLQPDHVVIESSCTHCANSSQPRSTAWPVGLVDGSQVLHLEILRTCRQIHKEANSVLHAPKRITVRQYDGGGTCTELDRVSVDPACFFDSEKRIPHLELCFGERCSTASDDWAQIDALIKSLPEALEVDEMVLELYLCMDDSMNPFFHSGNTRGPVSSGSDHNPDHNHTIKEIAKIVRSRLLSRISAESCVLTVNQGPQTYRYRKAGPHDDNMVEEKVPFLSGSVFPSILVWQY